MKSFASRILISVTFMAVCLGFTSCEQLLLEKTGEECIYLAMTSKLKGFDPALSTDATSVDAQGMIYETLYQYTYLADQYVLEPCLAKEMGTFSEDGLIYTVSLEPGIVFQDNPCFVKTKGKGRELTAEDIIYSIKRLADVKVRSTGWWIFDERIKGLDEFRKQSSESSETDYSIEVSGLQAPDKYTIEFQLKNPYPQLPFILAMLYTAPVPHEAVEYYGVEFHNHPVGTGAYRLQSWQRGLRVAFAENPTYRDVRFPAPPEGVDIDEDIRSFVGEKLPLIPKVEMRVYKESQPMWLNFLLGRLDQSRIPKDSFETAIPVGGTTSPELKRKRINLTVQPRMIVAFVFFNMNDQLLGKHKKLRQAMSLVYDAQRRNEIFFNGCDNQATHVLPPPIPGYIEDYHNPYIGPDLERAKALLAEAGFPNGEGVPPLTYETAGGDATTRQMAEMLVNEMASIGIKLNVVTNTWPQFTEKIKGGNFQLGGSSWVGDYPDAENFLQTLYSKNGPQGSNNSNYDNPEYDRLFEEVARMEDSPERRALIREMVDIAVEDCPVIYTFYRNTYVLTHQWYRNYRFRDVGQGHIKYHWVDSEMRKILVREF